MVGALEGGGEDRVVGLEGGFQVGEGGKFGGEGVVGGC